MTPSRSRCGALRRTPGTEVLLLRTLPKERRQDVHLLRLPHSQARQRWEKTLAFTDGPHVESPRRLFGCPLVLGEGKSMEVQKYESRHLPGARTDPR